MSEVTERTPLSADVIESGASLFAPDVRETTARVEWVAAQCESTGSNATQIAGDIEAHYSLKGRKSPRGYGRASIVNAGTVVKLWGLAGIGKTSDKTYQRANVKSAGLTYMHVIDALDAARADHGGKRVTQLLKELNESLSTDVDKTVRLVAVWEAVQALIETTPEQGDPPVATFATFAGAVKRAETIWDQLSDAVIEEGIAALTPEQRVTFDRIAVILQNTQN